MCCGNAFNKLFLLLLASMLITFNCQNNQESEMEKLLPEEILGWIAGDTTETYDRETINGRNADIVSSSFLL